jgi:hypothetical protein
LLVTPDQELILIFGALHLVALALGGVLFVMFLRSESVDEYDPSSDDDEGPDGGGGGGNDRLPGPGRPRPGGGIPLPDAVPARARLRGHGKLRDAHPSLARRRVHEPHPTPARRTPARR